MLIRKFHLAQGINRFVIPSPKYNILSVQFQRNQLVAWVECSNPYIVDPNIYNIDPNMPIAEALIKREIRIAVYPTGDEFNLFADQADIENSRYISTCQNSDHGLVYHAYELL